MNLDRILILLLTITCHFSQAQDNWVNYTNNYYATDIIELDNGFWLSSAGGIYHHNAEMDETTYYNRGNSDIPSNSVNDLLNHPNGDIWMTTSLGICKLQNGQFQVGPQNLTGTLGITPENKIVVANYDNLYIQTNDMDFRSIAYPSYVAEIGGLEIDSNGLIYLNAVNFFAETYVARWKDDKWEILFSEFIYQTSITMDSENKLWFMSTHGLRYYDNDQWTDANVIDSLNEFSIGGLHTDTENNIIFEIKSECPKLFKWNGSTLNELEFAKEDCSDVNFIKPSSLTQDKYYAFNSKNGLYSFTSEAINNYEPYSQSPLIYNNVIFTLHPADGSHVIIYPGNIHLKSKGEWEQLHLPDDLVGHIINAGLDAENNIWITNKDFLWQFENNKWNNIPIPFEYDNDIDIMVIGDNGDIWVQSSLEFARYRNGNWQIYMSQDHDITSSIIKDIQIDNKNGDLWVSTFQGVRHFDGQSWIRYDFSPNNHTFSLAIGNDGVFVHSGGLSIIKDGTISSVQMPPEGYYGPFESELFYDRLEGELHISGSNYFATYSNDEWQEFSTTNSGVYNGYSYDITIDKNKNIWLSGAGGGICVYNKNGVMLSNGYDKPINNTLDIRVFPTLIQSINDINIVSSLGGEFNVSLSNVEGNVLHSNKIHLQANQTIDYRLPNLSHGIFFLTFQQGDVVWTEKVFKVD